MATLTDHITIAQLNREITINKFVFGQDDAGGNIKILVASFNVMASIEPISNSYILEQQQLKYGEGYRITVRYEPSRLLTPNDEIIYNFQIHKIQSITNQLEALKRFLVINTSTGNSESNTGTGTVYQPVKEYHWNAEGDEYTVQADDVKGWVGIMLVFRDKLQYMVIRSGTPLVSQVLYDQNAGTFTFSTLIIPLAPGETVDAYLINA